MLASECQKLKVPHGRVRLRAQTIFAVIAAGLSREASQKMSDGAQGSLR